MADDDLIRRGDAKKAMSPMLRDMISRGKACHILDGVPAIAALPAQGVAEVEERKFYHDEWPLVKLLDARSLGNGLLTDDGEAWRYRLTHSDARGKYDVLYRPTRKIAALAPAEAGGVEAPMPPQGWNVMQVGQTGWHVIRTADGWKVSRVFGPEILSREGGDVTSTSEPVAYLTGGAGATEAPAPVDAGGVEAHVNETPKSEHDARDVLTRAPVDDPKPEAPKGDKPKHEPKGKDDDC